MITEHGKSRIGNGSVAKDRFDDLIIDGSYEIGEKGIQGSILEYRKALSQPTPDDFMAWCSRLWGCEVTPHRLATKCRQDGDIIRPASPTKQP